jgi:site-specific DNA-methyltransferase (adenine-specific)
MNEGLPINKIVCGDNCEVMRTLPSESIDLVVTSPPYDDLRTYGGHSWDFYGVAWNLKRLLKVGGVIVWIVADATKNGSETGTSMRQALHFQSIGLNIHDTMIWEKTGQGACGSNSCYWQNWEYMFVISKGRLSTFNPIEDRKNASGVGKCVAPSGKDESGKWKYKREIETRDLGRRFNHWTIAAEGGLHPAPFPEALARDHILSWSNEGDIVLDPFSGSGTTAKMAKHNGRRFIGIEVNQEYCDIAEKRLAQDVLF